MGALLGFVVGYVAGVKAGPEGLEELRRAWQAIQQSEEFQALLATATGVVQNALAEGGATVADQLRAISTANADLGRAFGLSRDGELLEALSRISQSADLQTLLSTGMALISGALEQGRATVRQAGA